VLLFGRLKLKQQHDLIDALYSRLSRDDEQFGDSSSIQTQKAMLGQYAKQNGLTNPVYFVDDGYSGTNFNRPDFQKLVELIEKGQVRSITVKDLSRFGRDYLHVGLYTEQFFPDHDVRFIAIEDNVDSAKGDNEFAPFKNIMNEWYARDVSKKVRTGIRIKAQQGLYMGSFAPYGYRKSPDNKLKLIVDEQTAPIVRLIFELCSKGMSAHKIARHLQHSRIRTPRETLIAEQGIFANEAAPHPFGWLDSTVYTILKNRVYLGHMVSQKSTPKSYKNKKRIIRPETDWVEVKNTHEAIISEDLFEVVQKEIKIKRVYNKGEFVNLFVGKIFCADCGKPMHIASVVQGKYSYTCSVYKRHGKGACGMHYVKYSRLYDIVLGRIKQMASDVCGNTEYFVSELQKSIGKNADSEKQRLQKCVTASERRISEINAIIKKLYEDNALGRITDERFMLLSGEYEQEQKALQVQAAAAKKELSAITESQTGTNKFISVIQRYKDLTELTEAIIIELIDKIIVHEGVWNDGSTIQSNGVRAGQGSRKQQIDIHYNFVGTVQSAISQTHVQNQYTYQYSPQ